MGSNAFAYCSCHSSFGTASYPSSPYLISPSFTFTCVNMTCACVLGCIVTILPSTPVTFPACVMDNISVCFIGHFLRLHPSVGTSYPFSFLVFSCCCIANCDLFISVVTFRYSMVILSSVALLSVLVFLAVSLICLYLSLCVLCPPDCLLLNHLHHSHYCWIILPFTYLIRSSVLGLPIVFCKK